MQLRSVPSLERIIIGSFVFDVGETTPNKICCFHNIIIK